MIIENKILMEIKDLEQRQSKAIEQLRSLINEQIHRQHGCLYNEVDCEDLQTVIDILTGKLK